MASKITTIALVGLIGFGITTTSIQSAKAEPITIGIGLIMLTKALLAKGVIVGVTAAKVGASKAVITGAIKGGAMGLAKKTAIQGGRIVLKNGARRSTQNGAFRGAAKGAINELQDRAKDRAKAAAF